MKITDIKVSINKVIHEKIPDCPINSNDIRESLEAGNFYVTFTQSKKTMENKHMYKRELGVRIYYCPKSKHSYNMECMEMQYRLEDAFEKYLKIGDRVITLDETEALVQDGLLLFDFDIDFYESYNDSLENDGILMKNLNLTTKTI